jgi:Ras family protein A
MPSISRNLTSAHDIPTLILGLKRDLRSETDPNGIIYPQEAYRIAQEMRCDKYMECSALTGELMKEAWEDICRTSAKCVVGRAGMVGGDGEDTDRGERSQGGLSEGACVIM